MMFDQRGYGVGPAATPQYRPPGRLPGHAAVAYWRELILLALILLALPWLVRHLLTSPATVLAGRGATAGAG